MAYPEIDALIDSHCHIDFDCFDHDRESLLARCFDLGITKLVLPATQRSGWKKLLLLTEQYPQLYACLGLHPYFLGSFQPQDLVVLEQLIAKYRQEIVAVGEIGLDAVIDIDWQTQVQVFIQQLALASEHQLPVVLHHRKSHNEILRLLKKYKFSHGGIVHAFSGSYQQAISYTDLGFKLGVGGTITYPRGSKTRDTLSKVALTDLVVETDSPDMPVFGRQGQRNSPLSLPVIFDALCEIRSESPQQIKAALGQNTFQALANMSELTDT